VTSRFCRAHLWLEFCQGFFCQLDHLRIGQF
jgi:hypothetical protein